MDILYLQNDSNVSFEFASVFRRNGHDANLLFLEKHIGHHPLWSIIETDIEEIAGEEGYKFHPKEWINDNRDSLPSWIEAVPTSNPRGMGTEMKNPAFNIRFIRKIREYDPDVIHATGIYAAIWASFTGLPYVYWVKGIADWHADDIGSPVKRYFFKKLVNRAVANAEIVVAQPVVMEQFKLDYDLECKMLPIILDLERWGPKTDKSIGQFKSKFDSENLFFAGARHDWNIKGNDLLIHAIHEVDRDDCHFLISDWGPDVHRTKQLAAELGVTDKVSFIPIVSQARLRTLINACDGVFGAFALGGVGSLGRQVLASGTPLIKQYDGTPYRESFGWEHPVVNVSTQEEIADAIEKLCETSISDSIGQESRKFMEKHYGWGPLGKEYLNLYKSVCY